MRVKNEQDHGLLQLLGTDQLRQSLPERAIADLIMILSKKIVASGGK